MFGSPKEVPAGGLVSLRGVGKTYDPESDVPTRAVRSVDLDVSAGEFVTVVGRSGSGKTTLLNLIAGLAEPTAGRVSVDGVDLWELSDDGRSGLRNEKIGFVFQFPSLIPTLTVVENVMLPRVFSGEHGRDDGSEGHALRTLELVGLGDRAGAYPRQLSAGQQQRVVFARSLTNDPRIILADEPCSNLDETTEQEIMALFRKVYESTGLTVLMVTHSAGSVSFATRSIRMAEGAIVADERTDKGGQREYRGKTTVSRA